MNSAIYRWCGVPLCRNTSVKTPDKLFISAPKSNVRKKWLQLARRDDAVHLKSNLYFCEDHFDIPNDMQNYMEYNIMGSVRRVQMKPGCLPSKFECQNRKQPAETFTLTRPLIKKRQRQTLKEQAQEGQKRRRNCEEIIFPGQVLSVSSGYHGNSTLELQPPVHAGCTSNTEHSEFNSSPTCQKRCWCTKFYLVYNAWFRCIFDC